MFDRSCSGSAHKLTCNSSFYNVGGSNYNGTGPRQGALPKTFKENNPEKFSFLNLLTNETPPRMFSLACNLLKMDAYSNDFEKIFLLTNSWIASR